MERSANGASGAPLGKEVQEMARLLTDLGLDARQAKVLAYLAEAREAKSAQIERVCRLRQPEVSVATKGLRERGWLAAAERRGLGRGRPVNYYRLERPMPEIVDTLAERKQREAEEELRKIERLRALVAHEVSGVRSPPAP